MSFEVEYSGSAYLVTNMFFAVPVDTYRLISRQSNLTTHDMGQSGPVRFSISTAKKRPSVGRYQILYLRYEYRLIELLHKET